LFPGESATLPDAALLCDLWKATPGTMEPDPVHNTVTLCRNIRRLLDAGFRLVGSRGDGSCGIYCALLYVYLCSDVLNPLAELIKQQNKVYANHLRRLLSYTPFHREFEYIGPTDVCELVSKLAPGLAVPRFILNMKTTNWQPPENYKQMEVFVVLAGHHFFLAVAPNEEK
jgi:hypothetical protein